MDSGAKRSSALFVCVLTLCACSGPRADVAPWRQSPVAALDADAGPKESVLANKRSCERHRLDARVIAIAPRQYVNLLRDVLGQDAVSNDDAAANSELVFDTVDLSAMTTAMLSRLENLSDGAIESLRGHTGSFLACENLEDDDCIRASLANVARQTFSRPVESDELDALMELYTSAKVAGPNDAGESAALAALQAVLLAPSTLYRTEFRAGLTPASEQPLTVYERASALAAFLLDSVPDLPLLAAADDGSLMTPDGLSKQIDRLLTLPRVQTHLTTLLLNAFEVPKIFSTRKDTSLFPEFDAALRNSMYEESRRFVNDILWERSAPLAELLTAHQSFIDAPLAKLYDVDAPSGSDAMTTGSDRAGLLTQASVLSVLSRTDVNSVVARGLFVRNKLLCLPAIPGPPASVQAQVTAQLAAKATQSELAEYRASTAPCFSCHQQFDPFGLLLESFDPIGRRVLAPLQTVDLSSFAPLTGTVTDVTELVTQVEQAQLFEHCLADRTLSYALSIATDSRQLCLNDSAAPTPASGSIRDLVQAIASSPAFNTRTIEMEP